jgi:hypothetical protein
VFNFRYTTPPARNNRKVIRTHLNNKVYGTAESTFQIKKPIARHAEQHCKFYSACFTLQPPSLNLLFTWYRKKWICYIDLLGIAIKCHSGSFHTNKNLLKVK